jgi:cyclohexyl-isocyanide hydratase
MLGVETLEERVVVDGNRITGGGITAGIDFALVLTAKAGGEAMAKTIQLALEYNPEPPYQSGNPTDAEPYIVRLALDSTQAVYDLRKKIITEMIAEGRPK